MHLESFPRKFKVLINDIRFEKTFSNLNGAKPTIYTKTTDKNNTSRSFQKICCNVKHFE